MKYLCRHAYISMLPRLPLLPIQHSRCYRVYESLATRLCWFCNDVLALQEAGLWVPAQITGFTGNDTRSSKSTDGVFATTSLSFLVQGTREIDSLCRLLSKEECG